MPHFVEQARTYGECIERIKTKYGKDFKVLMERTIRKGSFLGLFSHEEVELTGTYGTFSGTADRPAVPLDLEAEKRKVLIAAGKVVPEPSMQTVLKEIANLSGAVRSLNEKVDSTVSSSKMPFAGQTLGNAIHPSLQKLEEDLYQNDFTPSFTKAILDRVRREFPLNELDDYDEVQKRVILWIGEKISIYQEQEPAHQGKKKPRVIVLVGPTGAGKTTTIVKLATLYGERKKTEEVWKKQVRLITLDCYRIGAEAQIQKYGDIMELPVGPANSFDSLKELLAFYRQDVDFILIDTIGNSPRNYTELGKMKAMLDACPARTEVHLCVQASTKSGDLREILKQFEPFKYKSVIITKLDETSRIGNVISVLAEERKNISFLTTGQTVPWDLERATIIRFLINLEGFTVDRLALVDHFRS